MAASDDVVMYPELMSCDILKKILEQLNIATTNFLDKEELLGLYRRHALPLPQRKYRTTRHGQLLTKNQMRLMKRKKIDVREDVSSPQKKLFLGESMPETPAHKNRLKPPPSQINSDRKTIKLGSVKNTYSSSTNKDKTTHSSSSESKNGASSVSELSPHSKTERTNSQLVRSGNLQVCKGKNLMSMSGNKTAQETAEDAASHFSPKKPKTNIPRISWP